MLQCPKSSLPPGGASCMVAHFLGPLLLLMQTTAVLAAINPLFHQLSVSGRIELDAAF